jgi:hydroxymethylglutaryl-CoA reductase (NADPH)
MAKQFSWRLIGKSQPLVQQVSLRRQKLEQLIGKKLLNIACFSLDPEKVAGRNLENMIGATQVPLGVAGPLRVHSSQGLKDYQLPLATTEGALVASINRGCKLITAAGGCQIRVEEIGATRGPVFRVRNLAEGKKVKQWLEKNKQQLQELASQTDKHLGLKQWQLKQVGRSLYLRFEFSTGEAMGMNMVTLATEKLAELIKRELEVVCVALSGNFCVDKKPSWLNFVSGRGKQVWAEVVVDRRLVRQILKTSPEKIVEVNYRKHLLGSALSGSMAFNGHYANMVAAIFLATGQDLAQVVEASLGITTAELIGKNKLYFSVYLPDLMVGTVGGGTQLATQKEALAILGLDQAKKGDALRLAEVIGGAVLAGELSLTAALASGDLAQAHQQLGRGK